MTDIHQLHDDDARFLLFRIGGQLYGTPLLGLREVVEPQEPKPIPNTVSFFSGVINIRGQVVGVVDLRKRFGCEASKLPRMALMVFSTESGPLGALVDEIECVVKIPATKIESKAVIRTQVPADYFIGIGNQDGRLISLIDLNKILGTEELKAAHAICE
jgi:purine-binding chemotaxis protein CheW